MSQLKHLTVTRDTLGVGDALVARLQELGVAAHLHAAAEIPENSDGLVFLDGLDPVLSRKNSMALNRTAFLAAKKAGAQLSQGPGLFVTVQNTGGDFGLKGSAGCWGAGLSGLAKTARLEWPQAWVKSIDLDCGNRTAPELAHVLAQELVSGGDEVEVGLHRDGARTTMTLVTLAMTAATATTASEVSSPASGTPRPAVDASSVILATGGARGVTARCLISLAQEFKPRGFILCGRTPLESEPECCRDIQGEAALKQALMKAARAAGETPTPRALGALAERVVRNREILANIQALREAGSQVEYICADICDAASLRAALEPICADMGPLTGIVHGAGVLADKLIVEKTAEQFDSVFHGKVRGLDQLLEAAEGSPLSLLCVFSSVAARSGNLGQSDYAMANEVLNKVAGFEATRRAGACLVKSFNWGPWEGGMVTPELSRHFRGLGIKMIPLQEGAEIFVNEIRAANRADVEIVVGSTSLHAH